MDGGAWWAVVHGVAKSRTRLSDFTSLHLHPDPTNSYVKVPLDLEPPIPWKAINKFKKKEKRKQLYLAIGSLKRC